MNVIVILLTKNVETKTLFQVVKWTNIPYYWALQQARANRVPWAQPQKMAPKDRGKEEQKEEKRGEKREEIKKGGERAMVDGDPTIFWYRAYHLICTSEGSRGPQCCRYGPVLQKFSKTIYFHTELYNKIRFTVGFWYKYTFL